jgi:N-acetylglucosaminyldiphosphoundecaprenol N-acetyl-beta-D-mannosaminyltransferase
MKLQILQTDLGFLAPEFALKPQTVRVLGLRLHCLSYGEMHEAFDWWISDRTRPSLAVALVNVNCSVSAIKDPKSFSCYQAAGIRGIDSTPFRWLAQLISGRKLDRLYAPDIMLEVAARSQSKQYRFFLLGGMPGACETIAAKLTRDYANLRIVGSYCPPFRPLTAEEDDALVAAVNAANPDFVWVGLGSPKQDLWIQEHREKIRGTVMIASGATFDFFSGRIRQAPKWIRSSGLEWIFRLGQDTRRLWKRYTLYNLIFVACFSAELLGLREWGLSPASRTEP